MQIDNNLTNAQMLLQRGRFKEAEAAARYALTNNPEDGIGHAVLAFALSRQQRKDEARREIELAIQFAPAEAYIHYLHALILGEQRRAKEAIAAIQEAIRLAPEDDEYYALLGKFHLDKYEWEKALKAAEQGRALDPENVLCANIMAMALTKLGRKAEVQQVLGEALSRDPENALTQANQGWALLYSGQTELALMHFKEALRLMPGMGYAQHGILEALRARNFIYRVMLRYFLWMSRLSPGARWGVVLGAYFGARLLRMVAVSWPTLAPIAFILLMLYNLFVLLTWVARPMTDILLRLDKYGRLVLSRDQIHATNVGLILLAGAGMFALAGLYSGDAYFFNAALGTLALVLPVFGTFQAPPGTKRSLLGGYTVLLGLVGAGSLILNQTGNPLAQTGFTIFFFGWLAFPWVANIVVSVKRG